MRPLPAFLAAAVLGCASASKEPPALEGASGPKPGLYAVLTTARGDVEVRLFKDDAPLTVAAFLAQGMSADDALLLAVHLHGAAGDELAKQQATIGMSTTEVTEWARWLLNQWI